MNKQEILDLSNEKLNDLVNELRGFNTDGVVFTSTLGLYPEDIDVAWELFESVYKRGGKIKDGA